MSKRKATTVAAAAEPSSFCQRRKQSKPSSAASVDGADETINDGEKEDDEEMKRLEGTLIDIVSRRGYDKTC
jgi:hypothetical protein